MHVPDLNNESFTTLTMSRQLKDVEAIINTCTKPIVLIGSSMGGLTACILSEMHHNIAKIILLAPAFKMSKLWQDGITDEQLKTWQDTGFQDTFHYGYNKNMKLQYEFYTNLFTHNDHTFKRKIPCLIFHGMNDTVVPISLSEEYVKSNQQSQLISLDDDHSVNKYLDKMWDMSVEFILK